MVNKKGLEGRILTLMLTLTIVMAQVPSLVQKEKKFQKALLEDYNKNIVPIPDDNDTVTVTMDMIPYYIVEVVSLRIDRIRDI
jgi:hypothetical protein